MDEHTHSDTANKPIILVIDDNMILLRTVKEMLESMFVVRIAKSTEQAIETFKAVVPHLILLDYEMPEMNGEETLKLFRSYPQIKHVPIIFLTGSSDAKTVKKLLSLNPEGYVIKPAKKNILIEHIRRVLFPEEFIEDEEDENDKKIEEIINS